VTTYHGTHLDLETLAELDEGLLAADATATAEAHLVGCSGCREQLGAVRATRALLSALPDEPIPASVASRLDAALTGAAGTATVVPITAPRRSRWFGRPTGAGLAAAAVVAALVGAVLVPVLRNDDGTDRGATSALNARAPQENGGVAYPIFATDTTYTQANAAQRVSALEQLAQTGVTGDSSAEVQAPQVRDAGQVPAETRSLYVSSEQLISCVAKLTAGGPAVLPVAVDFVRFSDPKRDLDRAPAVAILLPQQFGSRDGVFVVGPDCATAPDQDLYLFAPAS
jgi:hypothetical protein